MHSGTIYLTVAFAAFLATLLPAVQARPSPQVGNPVDTGLNQDQMISGVSQDGKTYFLCLDANPAALADYPTSNLNWALLEQPNDSCRLVSDAPFSVGAKGSDVQTLIAHRGPKGNYFFSTAANNQFTTTFSSWISETLNVQVPIYGTSTGWEDSTHHMQAEGAMWNWKFEVISTSGSDSNDQSLTFTLRENAGSIPRWINIIPNSGQDKNQPPNVLYANQTKGDSPTVWTIQNYAA